MKESIGRKQWVVWEGFSDVFRAVGLGVGAIWTLYFLGDRKKISFFWVGRGSPRAWAGEKLLINVLLSKRTLAEAFAHT
jgi:hypothetical protein